jgi:glycerophosphoryl diester phosphodiesterase
MAKILNVAHRGFTKEFPDNTLEAFEAAMKIPVDAIECDIHETNDHHFIVHHDAELMGRNISELSLAEVRAVKLRDRYRIPTLEETLELCGRRAILLLEIKQAQSLESFVKLVTARVKPAEVVLISFNRDIVVKLADIAPDIRRGIITAFGVDEPAAMVKSIKADAMVVRCPLATAKTVKELRDSNISIYVWGCQDMRETRGKLRLDIDGMISDFPDLVAKELNKRCEFEI